MVKYVFCKYKIRVQVSLVLRSTHPTTRKINKVYKNVGLRIYFIFKSYLNLLRFFYFTLHEVFILSNSTYFIRCGGNREITIFRLI
jgi:hypothetical protein